jgi:hypothetical protein
MTSEKNIIEFQRKNKRADSLISLSTFRTKAQHYLTNIIEVQNSLLDSYSLFVGGSDIWRDQCEDIILLIGKASEFVDEFCRLVDINTKPPEAIIPLRYPLVVTLHYMKKQLSDLRHLVIQFCAICRIPSMQTAKQRQTIESRLKELLQSCDDLSQKVYALFDQADQNRFQKQKLANL